MTDATYLKRFYQALADRPLEPDEAWYVDLYGDPALAPFDPVEQLATGIEWSPSCSTHLFSGFRGTGKSTELRRLRARLQAQGTYKVVLCDMLETLHLSTPVEVADFLIALAGALGDALAADPDLLGQDPAHESYWTRLVNFLQHTDIEIDGVRATGRFGAGAVGLRANLRQDPSFRERLRERMEGHLGALVADVHAYVADCVGALQARHGPDTQVVLLLDSVEQIRGSSINTAEAVYASVEALFSNHAESLHFHDLHVVYTVPPWLKIRAPGVAGDYGGMQLLPCVPVRATDGRPLPAAVNALERVVARRGDWTRLLGERQRLDQIILVSGGYLRDLFRLLQGIMRQARGAPLPVSDQVIHHAIHEVRSSYLPLARADALWLAEIQGSQHTGLAVHRADGLDPKSLYHLSRFFDTHMVLCYRGDREWYDVHPLLRDEIVRQASEA